MTVVYIDLLFVLNLTANYLLLLAAGRMAGAVLARWRIGLGAALGALYAVLIFVPGLGWLAAWPCRAASGVLMVLTAYGGERQLLRLAVLFFGASAGLAGAVLALELLGSGPLMLEHGVFYSQIDLRLLLVLFAACYFVLSLRKALWTGGMIPVWYLLQLFAGEDLHRSPCRCLWSSAACQRASPQRITPCWNTASVRI